MNPDKASNASTMAPTSTSVPRASDTALTEAEFLQQESDDAKTAAVRALGELKSQIAAGIDPRGWVEDHPWLTLSGVAAASFVATSIAVPSKEQQALRKIAAVEAAIHRSESAKHNGNGNAKVEQPLLTMVAMELFSVLKPFFSELLTNLVRPPKEPPEQSPPSPR